MSNFASKVASSPTSSDGANGLAAEPLLPEFIEHLNEKSPEDIVDSLGTLANGLSAELSFLGRRLISHDTMKGSADLDVLTRLYLHTGYRISHSESTSLQTRLHWDDLWARFVDLYAAADDSGREKRLGAWLRGWRDFSIGCPCCNTGVPYVAIASTFRKHEAFFFTAERFKELWPEDKAVGFRSGQGYEGLRASREMVEEAVAGGEK